MNMDAQAHDLHARRMDRWSEADEWFKLQPLWAIKASLCELERLVNEDGPEAVVYRLAHTALLELVSRAHVRASQAERVTGGDDGQGNT
jgi:hypothetical protein